VWLQHRVIELEQDIQNLVACAVVEPGNLFTCEEQQGVAGLLQNGVPFVLLVCMIAPNTLQKKAPPAPAFYVPNKMLDCYSKIKHQMAL
jgi:hypothetical protein